MTTPLIEITDVVCELKVFDPTVANVFHEDQGPLRLVAVEYKLSFGAILSLSSSPYRREVGLRELTPASQLACEHKINVSILIDCWRFVFLCPLIDVRYDRQIIR